MQHRMQNLTGLLFIIGVIIVGANIAPPSTKTAATTTAFGCPTIATLFKVVRLHADDVEAADKLAWREGCKWFDKDTAVDSDNEHQELLGNEFACMRPRGEPDCVWTLAQSNKTGE